MYKPHRNSQKRIEGNYSYFVTCKTKGNFPYFENETLCELFIEELKLCKAIKKFQLFAFCLLYDHFHIMLKPNDEFGNLSKIMFSLKKQFSHDANRILKVNEKYLFNTRPIEGGQTFARLRDVHDKINIWRNDNKFDLPKFH